MFLLLFWLRFCFKHKKWLIDYCSTVATKTNNFSSFPWCIWQGMLRPPSVMSLVFLVQFLFWVGEHSDAHTQIHTKNPSNWNVDKLFHILYEGFLVIRLFSILFVRISFAFVAQIFYWFSAVNSAVAVVIVLCVYYFAKQTSCNEVTTLSMFAGFFPDFMPFVVYVGQFFCFIFLLVFVGFHRFAMHKERNKFQSSQKNSKNTENESKRERKKKWYAHLSIYNQFSASP